MKFWSLLTAIILSTTACKAQEKNTTQDQEAAYTKTIMSRAEKIVSTLQINDPSKAAVVTQIIANQYRSLNALHTERDLKLKEAKTRLTDKEAFEKEKKAVEESSTAKIDVLHKAYLSSLSAHLTPGQVDQVKDGMTYGVVPLFLNLLFAALPRSSLHGTKLFWYMLLPGLRWWFSPGLYRLWRKVK